MASLGSLGRKKPTINLDFDWFGQMIRVNPVASDLVELEFLRAASGIDLDDVDLSAELTEESFAKMSPQSQIKMTRVATSSTNIAVESMKKLIHPEDWDRFWTAAIANGQDLEDLLEVQKEISAAVAEARAGFPTGPSSDSSPGPGNTALKSAAGSPSPAPSAPRPNTSSVADKALAQLRGRPDLQEFIVMNEEHEKAKALAI